MTIHILGIDIAKSTFQLHGADNSGKVVLKKRLPRYKLSAYIANLPSCTIMMNLASKSSVLLDFREKMVYFTYKRWYGRPGTVEFPILYFRFDAPRAR